MISVICTRVRRKYVVDVLWKKSGWYGGNVGCDEILILVHSVTVI